MKQGIHYRLDSENHGPITADELKQLLKDYSFRSNAVVKMSESGKWRKASTIKAKKRTVSSKAMSYNRIVKSIDEYPGAGDYESQCAYALTSLCRAKFGIEVYYNNQSVALRLPNGQVGIHDGNPSIIKEFCSLLKNNCDYDIDIYSEMRPHLYQPGTNIWVYPRNEDGYHDIIRNIEGRETPVVQQNSQESAPSGRKNSSATYCHYCECHLSRGAGFVRKVPSSKSNPIPRTVCPSCYGQVEFEWAEVEELKEQEQKKNERDVIFVIIGVFLLIVMFVIMGLVEFGNN